MGVIAQPRLLLEVVRGGQSAIHVSVDDAIHSLAELVRRKPDSIFESNYFAFWRDLHDRFGVVVTHFLMDENSGVINGLPPFHLGELGARWRDEFYENPWLCWGIHGKNQDTPMICQTAAEIHAMVSLMSEKILEFSGQAKLPHSWRSHFFVSGADASRMMRARGVGVYLTPDDNRLITGSLPPSLAATMAKGGITAQDPISGLTCVRSEVRLERTTADEACRAIEKAVAATNVAAIFTHEHELLDIGWTDQWRARRADLARVVEFASTLGTFVQ